MAKVGNFEINIIEDSSDKKNMPLEVEVEYAGVKSNIKGERIDDVLDTYLRFDGSPLTPQELIDKVRELDKDKEKKPKDTREKSRKLVDKLFGRKEKEKTKEETKETTTEEEVKEPKIKIKKIGKTLLKIVAGGLFVVLLSTLGHWIYYNFIDKNKVDTNTDNGTGQEEDVNNLGVDTSFNTPEPAIINASQIPALERLPYIDGASRDLISMTDAEYRDALLSQSESSQANMNEISRFLEGEALEGTKVITDTQKYFVPGSVDYCIVEYFNDLRNQVANAAYDTGSVDNTRVILETNIKEAYLFANGKRSIALNTNQGIHEYNWYDSSNEAKNACLDALFGFAMALPHDCTIEIDGVTMTPQDFGMFYEAELAGLNLVNPSVK
jgi:hypothetical protein